MSTPVGPHLDHVHAAAQRHAEARHRHRHVHDEQAAQAYESANSSSQVRPPVTDSTR